MYNVLKSYRISSCLHALCYKDTWSHRITTPRHFELSLSLPQTRIFKSLICATRWWWYFKLRIFDSIELAKGLGWKEKWLKIREKDLIAFSFSAGLLIFYFKHFIKNVKHLISLKRSMKLKKLWKNLFYENENTSGYFFLKIWTIFFLVAKRSVFLK